MKISILEKEEELAEKLLCTRCHKAQPIPGKVRCLLCAEYGRTWQGKKTTNRKKNQKCITCGAPVNSTCRCDECATKKSNTYYLNKNS